MKTRTPRRLTLGLPFENGDKLNQAEFHRRYKKCPPDVRAELIGGAVYMASPTRFRHGSYQIGLALIFEYYASATAGVVAATEATILLHEESEPQPDALLRLLPEYGGRSQLDVDHYVKGAPELIGEIADSSASIDLGVKKYDYNRAGVHEYVVVCIDDQELHWFHFPSRRVLKPDRRGIVKSKVFPGLWIDPTALLARDSKRSIEVIQQGIASPEHAAYVEHLRRTRTKGK